MKDNLQFRMFENFDLNGQNFIDEQKILYIQMIQRNIYISNESIKKTLHKQCLETLKEIEKFSHFVKNECFIEMAHTDEARSIEVLCYLSGPSKHPSELFLWKLILDNMKNKNPVNSIGYSILHTIALCHPNEIEKYKLILELTEQQLL